MKKILLIIIIALNGFVINAENSETSSLKSALAEASAKDKPMLLNDIAFHYYRHFPDSAMVYCKEAEKLAEKQKNHYEHIRALEICGRAKNKKKDYEGSIKTLNTSVELWKKYKVDYNISDAIIYIAINYMQSADLHQAKNFMVDVLDNIEEFDFDIPNRARLYNNLGIIENQFGNYSIAIEYYIKALNLKETFVEPPSLRGTLLNIGNLMVRIKNYQEALTYYQRILQINRENDLSTKYANVYIGMGNVYLNLEKYAESKKYYQLALKQAEQENNLKNLSQSYNNLAVLCENEYKYDEALQYYFSALDLRKKLNDKYGITNLHKNIGSLYILIDDLAKAEYHLQKSLEYATENDAKMILEEAYKFLSQLYEKKKNYPKALSYQRKFFTVHDQILNESITDKILEVEKKYNTRATKRENQILKRDNEIMKLNIEKEKLDKIRLILILITILLVALFFFMLFYLKHRKNIFLQKSTELLDEQVKLRTQQLEDINLQLQEEIETRKNIENKLKKSLSEKELMLKEIHHRVKNNMQVVSSILDLQTEELHDDGLRILFQNTKNRIQSMSLIHEKLYHSDNFDQVDFQEYINSLIMHIYAGFHVDLNRIEPIIKIDNIPINLDYAVPCGMIVNELVTNTIKYAFDPEEKGKLWISLQKKETNDYILEIGNNGKDFPRNIDLENPTTIGLHLVNLLAAQIEGKLEVVKKNGVRYFLTFQYNISR